MTQQHLYPPYTVGVDMGGTNTAFAIVDSVGHILAKNCVSTATRTSEIWADLLSKEISMMIADCELDGEIMGIGVGAPCANSVTGCVEAATDLPWPSPIPLVSMIESRLGLPTVIANDANAAAIGEMTYGAAVGMKNFIVLTLGTGVGSGIVCDGHLLSGARGFAGELGHVTFPFAADRLCGCGRHGCLQTVAAAKGIRETARLMLERSQRPSMLRDMPESDRSPLAIEKAARAGDPLACDVYAFTGECLGKAAAEFAAFSDPEAIILFGGIARAGDLLLLPMREAFVANSLHLYRDRVRFLCSALDDAEAAILGAASLPYMQKPANKPI